MRTVQGTVLYGFTVKYSLRHGMRIKMSFLPTAYRNF